MESELTRMGMGTLSPLARMGMGSAAAQVMGSGLAGWEWEVNWQGGNGGSGVHGQGWEWGVNMQGCMRMGTETAWRRASKKKIKMAIAYFSTSSHDI